MNEQQINDNGAEASFLGGLGSGAIRIPIEFSADLALSFPINLKPQIPMSNPIVPPAKPLKPTLFQIAARADEPESLSAFKNSLAARQSRLGEKMLDAGKLEAVLDAVTRRKKQAPRRMTQLRIEKRVLATESQAA